MSHKDSNEPTIERFVVQRSNHWAIGMPNVNKHISAVIILKKRYGSGHHHIDTFIYYYLLSVSPPPPRPFIVHCSLTNERGVERVLVVLVICSD